MNSFSKLFLLPFFCLSSAVVFAKLNVVATTPDLGAIAHSVGGDKIDLTVLAKPTEDPHFVDAKPSFIVKLNHADAIIEGGAELEAGWLTPLLEGARNPKLEAGKPGRIAASEGVVLRDVPTTLDRSQGDIHASGNPHFLTDPLNAKIVAAHIARALVELAPESGDQFRSNLKTFDDALDAKMIEWQKLAAPFAGKAVVTYHDYWTYFGHRFIWPMELFLEPKPGIPPTPAHLAEVISKMKAENLKLITVQPYQNRKTAETIASHTGAVVIDFPSFPGGKGTEGYIEWMDFLVKSTVRGFEQTR